MVVFKSNNRVIHMNLEGITHEESLVSPEKGGNSINWILGHLIASRNDVFEIVKADKISDDKFLSLYKRGTKNVSPDKAFRIEDLLGMLDSTLNVLEEKIPGTDLSDNEENLKMLAFLSFHEAYHCGQIGILRRIIGKEGAIK